MADQELDFYQRLREKINIWIKSDDAKKSKWGDYIMLAPDFFHLMIKLAIDPEVPTKDKAKLAGAIAYFVSPLDLIPEAVLGPVGYVDDIALAAYVISGIIKHSSPEVVQKHWAGHDDILITIKEILDVADEMVGSGLWAKMKGIVKG